MAMNKKEKKELEDLKTKLALRFTEPVERDLMPPNTSDDFRKIVNGYSYNAYNLRIGKSCSSSIYHNRHGWDETTAQEPIEQYSTKLLALKAMRNEVELQSAKKLREIDLMIEQEVEAGE